MRQALMNEKLRAKFISQWCYYIISTLITKEEKSLAFGNELSRVSSFFRLEVTIGYLVCIRYLNFYDFKSGKPQQRKKDNCQSEK